MEPDAPNESPPDAEAKPAAEPAATAAEPETAAVVPEATAPAAPAEPVSPAKEWALAVALMVVFALIAAQFISLIRN
ncbi:MAG: hypothetical protein JWP87_5209 [Labilithrix sp.]|nr:hypothetical protein [Labilithrix sp.]